MSAVGAVLKRRPDADRRASIVAVARPIFMSEGYAATSMSTIAARVGGSKGTLYNYFPSKEELFIAVVESTCEEVLSLVYGAEVEGSDIRATLTTLGRRVVEYGMSDEMIAAYRMVTAEAVRFPEVGRAINESGFGKGVARLASWLESAMAKGQLRKADATVAAEQFFDLCNAGLFHRRIWNVAPMPSAAEIARRIEIATDTFLRAYAA